MTSERILLCSGTIGPVLKSPAGGREVEQSRSPLDPSGACRRSTPSRQCGRWKDVAGSGRGRIARLALRADHSWGDIWCGEFVADLRDHNGGIGFTRLEPTPLESRPIDIAAEQAALPVTIVIGAAKDGPSCYVLDDNPGAVYVLSWNRGNAGVNCGVESDVARSASAKFEVVTTPCEARNWARRVAAGSAVPSPERSSLSAGL